MEEIKNFNKERKVCDTCGNFLRPHGADIDKGGQIIMKYVCQTCKKMVSKETGIYAKYEYLNTPQCEKCGGALIKDSIRYSVNKDKIVVCMYCKNCKKKQSIYIDNFTLVDKNIK